MPDLITHLCITQIARRLFRLTSFPLLALGAIMPDILSRPFHILIPAAYWFVAPMHSPLVCLCYCSAISLLFARGIRRACFVSLCTGVALHLALDSLQDQVAPMYFWLFPFSWKSWWGGLFWSEQALFFLPVSLALTALISMKGCTVLPRRTQRSSRV